MFYSGDTANMAYSYLSVNMQFKIHFICVIIFLEKEVMFSVVLVCLCVCFFFYKQQYIKSYRRIAMKLYGGVTSPAYWEVNITQRKLIISFCFGL